MKAILCAVLLLSVPAFADPFEADDKCSPDDPTCKLKAPKAPKGQARVTGAPSGGTPALVRWPCPSCPGGFRWGDPATGQIYHQINGQFVAKTGQVESRDVLLSIARTQGYASGQAPAGTPGPVGAPGPVGVPGGTGQAAPSQLPQFTNLPSQFLPMPSREVAAVSTLFGAGVPVLPAPIGMAQVGTALSLGTKGNHGQGVKDPWETFVEEGRHKNDITWAGGAPVVVALNRQTASIPSNVGFYADVSDGKGGTKQDKSVLLTRGFGDRKDDFVPYLQSESGSYVAMQRTTTGYEPAYGKLNGQVGKPTEASMAGFTQFLISHGQVPKAGERFIGESTVTNEADARLLLARGDAKPFAASFVPGPDGKVVVKGGIAVGKTVGTEDVTLLVPPPPGGTEPVLLTVNREGHLLGREEGTGAPKFVEVKFDPKAGDKGTFTAAGVKPDFIETVAKFGPPREVIPVPPATPVEPAGDKKDDKKKD